MRLAAFVLLMLLAAPAAQAHRLKLFATLEGAVISGQAYFAGGGPAIELPGRLLGPDGAATAEFRTDAEGRFSVKAAARQDYTLAVDSGDGHTATFKVGRDELPPELPAGQAAVPSDLAQLVEAAVARQVKPLREQLDAYEAKVRLHDILGGIGTILGVFGLAAFAASRRKPPASQRKPQ
jgi:nickel transport protein